MESSAKQRKRKWFQSKYGPPGSDSPVAGNICKFFASSGVCRNGHTCKFLHESPASSKIPQPCKFLYTPPFRCLKEDRCHFSHECSSFPCPLMNIRQGHTCHPSCGFDHSSLVTESQRIAFVKTYHSIISNLAGAARVTWAFYLDEYSDEIPQVTHEYGANSNFFMVSKVGHLNKASWNRCTLK
jgi:hypothetical protein